MVAAMTRAWWLVCPLVFVATADDVGLVRIGENWRFTHVPPVEAEPAWFEPGFEAAGWSSGPAGFTFSSSTYEATSFSAQANPYGAVHLRHEFTVADPADIGWLTLRLDWSGGFILWLNGTEVMRENLPGLPGEPVDPSLQPPVRAREGPDLIDLTGWRHLLVAGPNCLAFQWHESSLGGYSSGLLPELLANFTRGPALQAATPTSQTILWRTAGPTEGWIEYGRDGQLIEQSPVSGPGTEHRVTLPDLWPDTEYEYRVVVRAGGRTSHCASRPFRTLKESGPIHFAVTADVGSGLARQYRVAQVLRQQQPDLVLMAGDLVYRYLVAGLVDYRWFSVYAGQLRTTPIFVVAGNHDVMYLSDDTYLDHFAMPTNSVAIAEQQLTGEGPVGHYDYSFDHGDAHFVGLYVPILYTTYGFPPDSPQLVWLEEDLAASAKPWKILFLHHPIMSSGPHSTDDYNRSGQRDVPEVAGRLMPIAMRHGVQLVFSGHDHIYERFTPVHGIQAIISGCGGGAPYGISRHEPASLLNFTHGHCVDVRIDGGHCTLRAVNELGVEFDNYHFNLTPPEQAVFQAARHTPDSGSGLPPDGDGNRVGQRFDFTGEPIPGVAGQFSNPGRLWVNADDFHLHLGIEQMGIPEGDDLILFIGVEGRPGATTLAGLGNGLPPPDAEGANALDLLENLNFAPGFEPTLALVLGDEYADGTDRHFVRTNVVEIHLPEAENQLVMRPVAMGQGAFFLKPGFPEVAGAKLEQFNNSPQSTSSSYEQSANFAVASVPLSALGLVGGERLRVGGIVARADPPAEVGARARWLDTAFLGRTFDGAGFAPAELAGVTVQLPPLGLRLRARRLPPGDLEFSWLTEPGKDYRLQQASTPDGPFLDAIETPEVLVTANGTATLVLPVDRLPAGVTTFFRLRALP